MGWTSRRAVNEIVRLFSSSLSGSRSGSRSARVKAGHAGTLDPLATGMLPILIGEATRFADFGLGASKTYQFTFDLSYQTDTLDCEGEVLCRFEGMDFLDQQQVRDVIHAFAGPMEQIPPAYSAIRLDGKRSHELARKGQSPQLAARPVNIETIRIDAVQLPSVTLTVTCSKGTYIRSLARDIADQLHGGGCVTMLRRLSMGDWPESLMVDFETLSDQPHNFTMPMTQWLRGFAQCELDDSGARRFVQGQRIPLRLSLSGDGYAEGDLVQVIFRQTLLGLALVRAGTKALVLQPEKVLPSAQQALKNVTGEK